MTYAPVSENPSLHVVFRRASDYPFPFGTFSKILNSNKTDKIKILNTENRKLIN